MTAFILPFGKMHGLGNDFVMLERQHLPNGVDESKLSKLMCDRHFGIGADGIIIVDFSHTKEADFAWSYYNSDGSEAEMCGNGMRCFAKYIYERGLTNEISFSVQTKAGIIYPVIENDGTVTVRMGKPKLPDQLKEKLIIESNDFYYTYIEIGNPHCVIFTQQEISDDDFYCFGPKIEKHCAFKNRINVEFVNIIDKNNIRCRVWERGAGPTLACGTGACAALVAAHLNNFTDVDADVLLPGGILKVWWDKNQNVVYLNGSAEFVYDGEYPLDPKTVCK